MDFDKEESTKNPVDFLYRLNTKLGNANFRYTPTFIERYKVHFTHMKHKYTLQFFNLHITKLVDFGNFQEHV